MGDIDFAYLEKLKTDGNAVAAFKMIYNYITKTASTKINSDHSTVAKVVDHLLLILPKIAQIPKYQKSMKSIAGRLQMDLWALYNNNSHAILKSKDREADWVAGRRAWLILDKFTLSKRFVRALFHTCEFARFDSMISLFREFRQEVVQYSSIPGFGVCLTNELLILMNDKYKPEEAEDSENLLQQQFVTPTRETFKEIRAFVNALKAIVFEFPTFQAKSRAWKTHHLICIGRIVQILKKYLTSANILMTENIDENDIQEVIYGFAQITHNLCQSLTPVPKEQACEQKTKDLWFALDGVLLPLNQCIGSMALALSSLQQQAEVTDEYEVKHKYPCFAVYAFLRLIQTVEKQREELTDSSRAIFVETALKNVKGCFSYLMSAAQSDDEFCTYQHWSLVELTINELSWIFEQHGLCSYERTNIMDIYNALAIKVSGHRNCTKMETLMVKMFLNQLLSQPFKRSPSPVHANLFAMFNVEKKAQVQFITILISLLTESGPPQLPESISLLVATLNDFSEYRKLPEGEQDLLKLVIFQLREVFPEETKKLILQCSKSEEVTNDELTCVWKILSSWQKDLKTAWSAKMSKKSSPPIRLEIENLCNIKVREQFSKCSTTTAVLNYVNTIYIAAELLLIVGKREAGTLLLTKLLKLIVDWYYPKKDAELEAVSSLIADLAMDLGSSMWVINKHNIYSSNGDYDDEIGEIMKKARECIIKSEHERRLAFGNLMNENILASDRKLCDFADQEELDMVSSLRETPLSSASPWSEYHDKALGHVGSMMTDHHKCGLRYAIQLLVTVLSLNCDRSFYSTLFSTSAKSQGPLKIQKIGREILSTLRSLEKTIWISAEHVEDLLIRGMSTEARQFANELLVLSEIWGLQSTYILAKSFQIRALELEGQTRKWREEVPALLKIFKLDSQSEFMRGINPQAKAAAISLDPPRRNSSNIEEMSENGLKSTAIKKDFSFDCSASPITKIMAEKNQPKATKINFKLPVLPKMADLDIDVARNYVIALTTLLRVHPDPQIAVNAGSRLFNEVSAAGLTLSQWLLELAFVVILRALELTSPTQAVDLIREKIAGINNTEIMNPKNCRRFARFQVAQIIYDRTFKASKDQIELEGNDFELKTHYFQIYI